MARLTPADLAALRARIGSLHEQSHSVVFPSDHAAELLRGSEEAGRLREALTGLREAAVKAGAHMVVVDADTQQSAAFTRLCDAIDNADAALARIDAQPAEVKP